MDIDRIERALREGPLDEPRYVPGSFRRSTQPGWWFAAAGLSVGLALIAGVAIGIGLGVLRGDFAGGPEPRVPVAADLQGVWESDPVEHQAFVDALRARGFPQEEIDAFLEHDPFEDRVRYALRFIDDRLIVQAAYDELPFQTLSIGTFTILGDGTLRFIEIVDGVRAACEPLTAPRIDGDRLTMNVLELPGCVTDERIAHTLFFEIASYSRTEE